MSEDPAKGSHTIIHKMVNAKTFINCYKVVSIILIKRGNVKMKTYKDNKGNLVELVGQYEDIDQNGFYKVFVLQYVNGQQIGVADIPFRKNYTLV